MRKSDFHFHRGVLLNPHTPNMLDMASNNLAQTADRIGGLIMAAVMALIFAVVSVWAVSVYPPTTGAEWLATAFTVGFVAGLVRIVFS